jgi:hypothetical protein
VDAREVSRVTRALAWASVCCVLGLFLVVAALVIAWMTTRTAPISLVKVTTATSDVCGELISADQRQVVIHTAVSGTVAIPQATVVSLHPIHSCGMAP